MPTTTSTTHKMAVKSKKAGANGTTNIASKKVSKAKPKATQVNKKKTNNQRDSSLVDQLTTMEASESGSESDSDNQKEEEDLFQDAMDVSSNSQKATRGTTSSPTQQSSQQQHQQQQTFNKPSKIPTLSPVKKKKTSRNSSLTNTATLSQIETEMKALVTGINSSTSHNSVSSLQKLFELNSKYLSEAKAKLDSNLKTQLMKSESICERLMIENESLKDKITELASSGTKAESTSEKDSNVIFDILELLANISCLEFVEDDEKMHFKLRQTSTNQNIEMVYRLVINKSDKIDEILYKPCFKDLENSQAVKDLKTRLPDYFLDELSFPSSNLNNFYNKVNRSLNKSI